MIWDRALRVFYTIACPEPARGTWTARTDRIDGGLTRDASRGVQHPPVYLASPSGLVQESRRLLDEVVHLSDTDVRTDDLDGA